MYESNLCPAHNADGSDCLAQRFPDSPGGLCAKHLRQAHEFWAEVEAIEYKRQRGESPPVKERWAYIHRPGPQFDNPQPKRSSLVYYLRFQGMIKIGTTVNLAKRLQAIPHDEVLATEPGGTEVERRRHAEFREYRRAHREWFLPGPRLMDHIDRLNTIAPVDSAS